METESILVDVPERISFELSVPVIDPGSAEPEEMDAGDTSYIFSRMGHQDFPRSLRTISISARRDDELLRAIPRLELSRYFRA